MTKVVLGEWSGGGNVRMDVARFVETRGLIQASSGSGKSVALRTVLEATHGHVQQIIVDPEGEFASLREKCDLIIAAAQDGDVVAHPKTAKLLAIRLLETQASAVLDISELKVRERHQFVRLFFESLLEAPKALRHPVLVALDEAHMFAPEKGQGESEALEAVIDLASLGRKRGLSLLAATQRIGKYHKSAAADLKNRLIGNTALDIDVKRAAFELGMTPKEALAILRPLEAGHFYAFGPAFEQTEPRQLKVAWPKTSHPKVGHKQRVAPPKPSEAIKALLPKLADLPREAEEQARTVEDLKRELASARRELTQVKRAQPAAVAAAPVIDKAAARRDAATIKRLRGVIEDLMKFIVKINAAGFAKDAGVDPEQLRAAVETAVGQARKIMEASAVQRTKALEALQREAGRIIASAQKLLADQSLEIEVDVTHNEPFTVAAAKKPLPTQFPIAKPKHRQASLGIDLAPLSAAAKKILTVLAQFPEGCTSGKLALLTGYRYSGGFRNSLSELRTAGLLEGENTGTMRITEDGHACGPFDPMPEGDELRRYWLQHQSFGKCSKDILAQLLEHPEGMTAEQLAGATDYEYSGGFRNSLSELRTAGVLVGKNTETMRASEELLA